VNQKKTDDPAAVASRSRAAGALASRRRPHLLCTAARVAASRLDTGCGGDRFGAGTLT